MAKIGTVIHDPRNNPEEMVRISRQVKPGKGEVEVLWRGELRNIPSEFWEQECQVGWSVGECLFDLSI